MGIYDRDYMAEKKAPLQPAASTRPPASRVERAPLWARIKFQLWLWFKRRK